MPYALITHASIDGQSASTATSAALVTTGANLLVVAVAYYTIAAGTTSVTDSKGNTWHKLTEQSAARYRVALWYAFAPTVGTGHTITVANGSGNTIYFSGLVAAFSGATITDPFDVQTGAVSGGSDTSLNAGSVTPTHANSLVVTAFGLDDPSPTTPACSGFTSSDTLDVITGARFGASLGYQIQTTAGAVNPHWTRATANTQGGDAAVVAVFSAAAGGTTFTAALSGDVTPAGAIVRVVGAHKAGAVTPAGALIRKALAAKSGAVGPTGALKNQTAQPKAGSVTPAGAVAKQAQKPLGGAVTSSGALSTVKVVLLALSGALTAAGGLVRKALVAKGGIVTPGANLTRAVSRQERGAVTPGGALAKQARKPVAGAVAPSGVLATIKVSLLALAGAVAASGALIRSTQTHLGGAVTPSSTIARVVRVMRTGTVTVTGSLGRLVRTVLSGLLAAAGQLVAGITGRPTFIPGPLHLGFADLRTAASVADLSTAIAVADLRASLQFLSPDGSAMMQTTTLILIQGDVVDVPITLLGAGNAPHDLTGLVSATLDVGTPSTPIITAGALTPQDPPGAGIVLFPKTPALTATPGRYAALVTATFTDGTVRKFPGLVIIEPSPTG